MHSLPDFIIIGAQKCGTTSLFAYLKQHSEIDLPEEKEIHYFDNKYDKGIEWYKSQFPDNSGKISGEATPYYLFHPHVKERIFKHCPNTKLIVMLRNSTDRAYSHFVMEKNRNNEPLLTFEDAIVAEPIRLEKEQNKINNDPKYCSKIHQRFSYLSRGKYYSQITEWLKYFPLERFLFIKSERFFMNPEKELHRVFYFLNVRHEIPSDMSPKGAINYPPMKIETRDFLNNYFASENQKLTKLLGIDFTWGS